MRVCCSQTIYSSGIFFAELMYVERRITTSVSVCLSVCLSARVSQKPYAQISRTCLYVSTVIVAPSSSDNDAACFVLLISWTTLCHYRLSTVNFVNRCCLAALSVHPAPAVKNWRFCWCKVSLPVCPCWRQPAHSYSGKDAGVFLNSAICAVSVPLDYSVLIS